MTDQILTGFGFGPIQSGLFAAEAFRGGAFGRIVIAEVDPVVVLAVRASGGAVAVNIAGRDGITVQRISGIEIYNPTVEADRVPLREALARSTAIVTALPLGRLFRAWAPPSVAALIAEALAASVAPATLIYTAENNNHAAEILERAVAARLGRPAGPRAQFLNTVIGKMSRVVTDPEEMRLKGLAPLTPRLRARPTSSKPSTASRSPAAASPVSAPASPASPKRTTSSPSRRPSFSATTPSTP